MRLANATPSFAHSACGELRLPKLNVRWEHSFPTVPALRFDVHWLLWRQVDVGAEVLVVHAVVDMVQDELQGTSPHDWERLDMIADTDLEQEEQIAWKSLISQILSRRITLQLW